MIYDLHTHSNASDGILTPAALVERAKAKGVEVLAVTDHDTVQGLPEAKVAAAAAGIDLICGIEFSTQWQGRSIHVVGLGIDLTAPSLQTGIQAQQQLREDRAIQIDHKLTKMGVQGALEGARAIAGAAILGRPHFAQYLVQKAYAASIAGAFKKYLGAGKPGDVKQLWPEIPDVIQWINTASGIAVLAHPDKYDMTRTKLCALVKDFADAGGGAIEVISGKQVQGVADKLARMANQFELRASCGSDFHVPNQPWQELGAFGTLPDFCEPVWRAWH